MGNLDVGGAACLAQGAVRIDGEAVPDGALDVPAAQLDGHVLQFGKRRFARVRVARAQP